MKRDLKSCAPVTQMGKRPPSPPGDGQAKEDYDRISETNHTLLWVILFLLGVMAAGSFFAR